jgi:hypothetical protein
MLTVAIKSVEGTEFAEPKHPCFMIGSCLHRCIVFDMINLPEHLLKSLQLVDIAGPLIMPTRTPRKPDPGGVSSIENVHDGMLDHLGKTL